ncbi:MAG TPA: oligosaccharide flippase family protein [Candidatus Polarisedimenticolia bacterium]|jgi:O-antigen/teichoic acid export membrane protein|nr:oligosaccharide flippase family protein [Candidatus Polarisedimenticolia bacterium]
MMSALEQKTGYTHFLRNQPVYLLSSILAGAISFLILPIYTRFLSPEDFGLWSLFSIAAQVFAVFLTCGLDSVAIKHWHLAQDIEARQKVVSQSLSLALVLGAIGSGLGILVFWLGHDIWVGRVHGGLIIVGTFIAALQSMLNVGMGVIRAQNRPFAFGCLSFTRVAVQLSVSGTAALRGHLNLQVAAWAWLAGEATALVILLAFLRPRALFARSFANEALQYGLPMVIAGFGNFVLFGADRYFLAGFRGLREVAVYAVAYKVATILEVAVVRPFAIGWAAGRFQVGSGDEGSAGYVRALALFLVPSVIMFAVVCCLRREIIALVAPAGYEKAAFLIPILLGAYFFLGLSYPLNVGVMFRDRPTPVAAATWVAVLLNTVGNIALIPSWGATGAALSTLVGYGILCLILWRSSLVTHPIDYPAVRFGVFTVMGCGLGVIASRFGTGTADIGAVGRVILVVALVTGLAHQLGLLGMATGSRRTRDLVGV